MLVIYVMHSGLSNLSIQVTSRSGGSYKSIKEMVWSDIPGLAILTGKNGSGKTQLLEALAYALSGAIPHGTIPGQVFPVQVTLQGVSYKPEDIAYIPSSGRFSGGVAVSVGTLQQARLHMLQYVQQTSSFINDINGTIRAKKIETRLAQQGITHFSLENLQKAFSDDFEFMLDDVDVTSGLTYVFVAYRLKYLESLERGTPGQSKEWLPLGPAPWDIVNQALAVADFPYTVISPSEIPIVENYELRLRDVHSGFEIPANDLSSGEKVILQLVLWLYTSPKEGIFPKLLLLDEPDAHLHPSMTTQFINVVSEVLVSTYNVRIIMTTHSPSTVALAPEGSVFQIKRGACTIDKVEQRADAISVLTSGMVTVSRSTKICLVEDDSDVRFYGVIRDILTDYGPSRDNLALKTSPSIVFLSASVGSGSTKVPGGATVVAKWVAKLDAEPLDRTFVGLIDRDTSNIAAKRLYVIGRYSCENYLLDPLNVACHLLSEGSSLIPKNLGVSPGDEHRLRTLPKHVLQSISNGVTNCVENTCPAIKSSTSYTVNYTNELNIQVPSWIVDHRGHDLFVLFQHVFGGSRIINPQGLLKSLRRGRFIPIELADIFHCIQNV